MGPCSSDLPDSDHPWRSPACRRVTLGAIDHAVYEWRPDAESASEETVVLLHGWMDSGRSYAPLVSELARARRYVALDWRGFGRSGHDPEGRYLIPDYVADLDAFLSRYDRPVSIIGHSLGANIGGLYAGIRPRRVSRFVSLEGFGLLDGPPSDAPGRYGDWLDGFADRAPRRYSSPDELAGRLQRRNPRLSEAMAGFLADCWTEPASRGVVLCGDPAHRSPNPMLYHSREVLACWRQIRARCLWIFGEESRYARTIMSADDWHERLAAVSDLAVQSVSGTSHSLHHERPGQVAALIERWWSGDTGTLQPPSGGLALR